MEVITTPQLVFWALGQVVVAAAIWGGIRADIRALTQRIARAETGLDDMHKRVDRYIDGTPQRRNGER